MGPICPRRPADRPLLDEVSWRQPYGLVVSEPELAEVEKGLRDLFAAPPEMMKRRALLCSPES
jgi:hypothetical protein